MSRFPDVNPYTRDAFWAAGVYDDIVKPGHSEAFKKRFAKLKAQCSARAKPFQIIEAKKFMKNLPQWR